MQRLRKLHDVFGDRAYVELTLWRRPNDQLRLYLLLSIRAVTQHFTKPRQDGPHRRETILLTTVEQIDCSNKQRNG